MLAEPLAWGCSGPFSGRTMSSLGWIMTWMRCGRRGEFGLWGEEERLLPSPTPLSASVLPACSAFRVPPDSSLTPTSSIVSHVSTRAEWHLSHSGYCNSSRLALSLPLLPSPPLTPLQPHWPPHCSSGTPNIHLPQGLCTRPVWYILPLR